MIFLGSQASPERACLTPSSPADPSAQYFEGGDAIVDILSFKEHHSAIVEPV